MKKTLIVVIVLSAVFIAACGRKTNEQNNEAITTNNEVEITQPVIKDKTLITPEDPFKNQPNEFCTVIRKLDISYYAPEKEVSDVTAYPEKYCLLDVCLEVTNPNSLSVNLGDGDEVVTTAYELIKVFESEGEAKAYAERWKVLDVKWE
jgi:hypothetical protein